MDIYEFIECCSSGAGSTRVLLRYGIYITNNARKMHNKPMARRIAGRKGARKPKSRKQFKIKGGKK